MSKQGHGGVRGKGKNITTHFADFLFFLLLLDFSSYISLLLQPRNLIVFLSLEFYVPEIQKLEMLWSTELLLHERRYFKDDTFLR